ncbi:hypothetical protein C5Y96_15330 [Blastopirellula marina]|uniref:Uncharacterized protein n=1 Tax=Blastopirellula marina TaxID=124 RepID=A0A2S8FB14_9BACT|nr:MULTISPECIES: hypothetical protein [Pirellulaceae]PQO29124.1 hypothetical protein C5Y96_15330 [Blastopirellula marina]RCS50315.1 hypothetical protein DTL36_15340 [Bremerella cremea]
MADETELELELLDQRPPQFGLMHLMGLMTALALATALLVPIFRTLPAYLTAIILIVLLIELCAVIGDWFIGTTRRQGVLALAGRQISLSGDDDPQAKPTSIGKMIVIGVEVLLAQIGIGIVAYSLGGNDVYWLVIVCQIQIALYVANQLIRQRWSIHDENAEFFENGIILGSFQFTPWERISVRPCRLYPDRVNLHIQSATKHVGPTLKTIPVSDSMKRYLLNQYGEADRSTQANGERA